MPARSLIQKLEKLYPQSLIAQIYKLFGVEDTEKFLNVFADMTIKVPSTQEIENEERNLAIYNTLQASTSGSQSRRMGAILCERYKVKRKELRKIFHETKRRLKEAKKIREADKLVGEHQKRKR